MRFQKRSNRKNLVLPCELRAATSSDVLLLSLIFLSVKDYHLQTGCPPTPSASEGPASLPALPRGQPRAACRDLAGCPRLADIVGLTGVGRHSVNEESSGPLIFQAIYKYPCVSSTAGKEKSHTVLLVECCLGSADLASCIFHGNEFSCILSI